MRPPLMLLPAALRRRFRRPTTYAWCGLALSLITGVVTYRLLDTAADGAARYGQAIEVAVARRDLAAGATISANDVELRSIPAGAVPPRAVRSRSVGRAVRQAIAAGQVLVDANLSGAGMSGTAAALPAGTVAVAIPRTAGSLRPATGDRVDLIEVSVDAATDQGVLSRDAVVVAVDDEALTVAVDEPDAPRVAAAAVTEAVVAVLRASG